MLPKIKLIHSNLLYNRIFRYDKYVRSHNKLTLIQSSKFPITLEILWILFFCEIPIIWELHSLFITFNWLCLLFSSWNFVLKYHEFIYSGFYQWNLSLWWCIIIYHSLSSACKIIKIKLTSVNEYVENGGIKNIFNKPGISLDAKRASKCWAHWKRKLAVSLNGHSILIAIEWTRALCIPISTFPIEFFAIFFFHPFSERAHEMTKPKPVLTCSLWFFVCTDCVDLWFWH